VNSKLSKIIQIALTSHLKASVANMAHIGN